jgi:septation ring formation regulator
MIKLKRIGSGFMSKTAFILIGISYYIVSIIVIIIVLNIINKKQSKKYATEISNLEREKNLIISASILSELNKVEPLINNADTKEIYNEWQRRFKEIKDVEVPKISDAILEIEELFNERKYKDLRKKIAEVELDICFVKTKSNFLLEEIRSITLSEEKNRETITKLKSSYREILAKYNSNLQDYALIGGTMELQFENVDKLFSAFENSMEQNAYQEVGKIVKAIDDTIGNLKIVIEEAPSIILMGKKLIPNKITSILKIKEKMEREGYNLEFLNLDYNISEANKKIVDIFQRLNVLNLEDSIFELKTILDFFESTENDFDKERIAKKIFEDYSRTILIKVTKLNKINNDLYKKIDDIKYSYDLGDEDVLVISEIHSNLKNIREKYDEIIELHRSKKSYFTKLAKEMESLNVELTKTEEKLERALRTIGSLKEDELRAREQLDEIKDILIKSKNNIRNFKLPIVPENYYVELSEASEAINEIVHELERTPISIKILNTRVDTARDLTLKVYNLSKEIVKTAKMAETAIVYGNRYRVNKEVDVGLTKAEIAFYKGNFKNSLENAINAINVVEPGIHKRLMEEYR